MKHTQLFKQQLGVWIMITIMVLTAAAVSVWLIPGLPGTSLLALVGLILRRWYFPLPRDARRMAVYLGAQVLSRKNILPETVGIRGCYNDACEAMPSVTHIDFSGIPKIFQPAIYMLLSWPFHCSFQEARDLVLGYAHAKTVRFLRAA